MAITAVLLAAGYATRLYPLTKDKPKALLPLGDGVILDDILAQLPGEVTKTVLVTNRRFVDQFRAWQAGRGALLTILDDGTETAETRLGAIRDLELARTRGGVEGDMVVIGTDNLFTWPLSRFIDQARRHAPAASVALWDAPSVQAATQFGVVQRDPSSRIVAFVEKSPAPPSREVALCVYYFPAPMHHLIQRFLETGENADAPGHFIKWLAAQQPVYGVMMDGAWYDIGSLEVYRKIRSEWPGRNDPAGRQQSQ